MTFRCTKYIAGNFVGANICGNENKGFHGV